MEETNPTLENQAKELNQKLTKLIKQRSLGYLFLTGILHSLGSVFGTVIVLGAIGFLASRFIQTVDLTQGAVDWVGRVMERSMENLVPQQTIPEVNLDELLNQINDLGGQE